MKEREARLDKYLETKKGKKPKMESNAMLSKGFKKFNQTRQTMSVERENLTHKYVSPFAPKQISQTKEDNYDRFIENAQRRLQRDMFRQVAQ